MTLKLKPLQQQVIFVNGACSELGEALVKEACIRGARVFMVDEDEDKLAVLLTERLSGHSECAFSVAQSMEVDQLNMALDHCVKTFGTVDTWINAVDHHYYSLIKHLEENKGQEVMDKNFWSAVAGSRVAADLLAKSGGVIINLGTCMKNESVALSGLYLASKKAVEVFSECFQQEIKDADHPILIQCLNSSDTLSSTVERLLLFAEKGTSSVLKSEFKNRYASFKDRLNSRKDNHQLMT